MTFRPITVVSLIVLVAAPLTAQHAPGEQGSRNMKIMSHLPLPGGGGGLMLAGTEVRTADVELEQELNRPYAYVPMYGRPSQLHVISLKDPSKAQILWTFTIENPELHRGAALAPAYVKTKGRYYLVNGYQFQQGGPDHDLGAIVWDMTGLPDTSKIREVGRIREPQVPGGFHEVFTYKHSSGAPLVITTTNSPYAHLYDLDRFIAKDPRQGLVSRVPVPDSAGNPYGIGFHDFYAAYDPATRQDKLYGAGNKGYYVFDITNLSDPKLVVSATGIAGMEFGHSVQTTPDGRYLVAQTEYQWAPIRIIDLKPGLDGTVKNVNRPIGAWTASWNGNPHNYEIRWPYVFVAAFEDGMHVFNMMDPTNPYTVGFYDTYDKPRAAGAMGQGMVGGMPGAWGVDVRNADGLIVATDMATGFWAFKMEGFDGWNGHQWGMPNISAAQDWDNGPDGAPKPQRVS